MPGSHPSSLLCLPLLCCQLTPDATGSLWLLMPILCPQIHYWPNQGNTKQLVPGGVSKSPHPWVENFPEYMKNCQGKAGEVPFSSTLGMMLRTSKTDSGCQDLVSSTVSHTPTPPAMGLSPPQTQGTGQGSLEGLMDFKEGETYANSQSPIVLLAPGAEQAPEVS